MVWDIFLECNCTFRISGHIAHQINLKSFSLQKMLDSKDDRNNMNFKLIDYITLLKLKKIVASRTSITFSPHQMEQPSSFMFWYGRPPPIQSHYIVQNPSLAKQLNWLCHSNFLYFPQYGIFYILCHLILNVGNFGGNAYFCCTLI